MIHSARSATALLALLASLTLQVTAEDEPQVTYELKYQFAAGQVLEYSVEDAKTIDVQVGDVADAVQQTLELGQVLRVDSIDADGNALIEARIDYAKLAADHQEEHIEWDSRSGEEPADEFRAIAETIGKPLGTVRLSPKGEGEVMSLRGSAATGPEEQKAQLDLFPLLPDAAVAVGDTWKEDFEIEIMATPTLKKSVALQRLFTLKSVEDGRATIEVRTIVLSPIRDPLEEGQLIQRTPSGTIVLDIESGKLLSRELKIDKRVVGFQGPQTSLQVTGIRNESLASEETVTTAQDSAIETSARP